MVKVGVIGSGDQTPDGQFFQMPGLAVKNKVGHSGSFGFARLGHARLGYYSPFAGVYQKRVTGYNSHGISATSKRGSYYVKMRYYRPTNPQTILQQNNRGKFADAILAWNGLTEPQKQTYNQRGKRLNRIGRNLFISEYMKSH